MQEHSSYLNHLLYLPQVWSAHLSPDGRWVAFNWYHRHDNMDVFVVPSDGAAPPVALTHTPEMTVFTSWLPDSSGVIVSEDHDRDELSRLFRVDLDRPGEMLPLTEDHPQYYLHGGFLSPDGRYLYYDANYDFAKNRLLEPSWVYRHDLQTGERKPIAFPRDPVWGEVRLNLQGTHILYSRSDLHPAGYQVYMVDVEGKEDRELFNFGAEVKTFGRWFPDGERILVISEGTGRGPQEHVSLGIYHRTEGSLKWILDDPQRQVETASVSPDGLVIVNEVVNAVRKPSFIDPQTGIETPFPSIPGNLVPVGRTPDGNWVGIYYSSLHPTDLVLFREDAASPDDLRSLTGVWNLTELTPGDIAPAESITWVSEDGLEIQGFLYRARPNPRRAIIFIHGGPTHHDEDEISAELQYFVRCGFNVLDVNYRGSTGFGVAYRESIKEDGWGGREQVDIAAGARKLIEMGLADDGRIGVTGTSYGGYSSWYLITHYPPALIAAAAPICGMTDLVVDYLTTRPDLRRYSEEMMGGSPEEAPERYRERSPIHFVQNIQGGLLIIQGARDPNVTPENVRQVEKRLKENGISYEKMIFDDEGHGILKTANQEVLYQRLAQFFDSALVAREVPGGL